MVRVMLRDDIKMTDLGKWSPGSVDPGLQSLLYGVEKLAFGHVGGGAANAPAC